jgi:antitoxin MazE
MQVNIKKWGSSTYVRIPDAVMRSANLSLDSVVDLRIENGRIVLEPVFPQKEVDLESLTAGITEENVHTEVIFGSAIGKEHSDGPSI